MKLLLLRHSLVQSNLEGRFSGTRDLPLVEEGRALALKQRGAFPAVDALWVSPMLRCRQTADLLFPGLEQRPVSDLRECDFGDFEGKTWEELAEHPVFLSWRRGEEATAFPGGDTLAEHMARCRRGGREILVQARQEGLEQIAILAHGGTVMALLTAFAKERRPYFQWLPQPCGGYLLAVTEGEGGPVLDVLEIF